MTLIRKSSSLDIATYASVAAMVLLGLSGLSNLWLQAAGLGLCAAFAIVYRVLFQTDRHEENPTLYFGAQTLLVTLMFTLRSTVSDAFNFLFYILTVQTALVLSSRAALVWIGLYFGISSVNALASRGVEGTYAVLFYLAAFLICGLLGRTFRQIELTSRRNQQLLDELRATQKQLQELAVVEERNRLARDLHDSAKQQAFALSAQLDAARSLVHRDPAAAETHIEHAEQLADNLRQELASLILELRPPEMGQAGFAAALKQYADDWSQQSNIEASVNVQGERVLPREVEHTLFRIAQEALANIARHSRAGHAEVQLNFDLGRVTLTVKDDGQGFDPARNKAGVGTHSMQERAATLPDGTLTLDSEPGRGTRVTVICNC